MSDKPDRPMGFSPGPLGVPQGGASESPGSMEFKGKVVRVEADGFGLVEFDKPIGPHTTHLGLFSNTTSTWLPPLNTLRVGVTVSGTAEADGRDLAAVKTLKIITLP